MATYVTGAPELVNSVLGKDNPESAEYSSEVRRSLKCSLVESPLIVNPMPTSTAMATHANLCKNSHGENDRAGR
jgi:hypothetical protein